MSLLIKGTFLLLVCLLIVSQILTSPLPYPDSADIVEMPPGLAYGGIPYGSVTGKVADFYGANTRSLSFYGTSGQHGQPLQPVYYHYN